MYNKRYQKEENKLAQGMGGGQPRDYGDNSAYLTEISQQHYTQQDFKNDLFGGAPTGLTASGPPPISEGVNLSEKLNPASLISYGDPAHKMNPELAVPTKYQDSDDKQPRAYAKASDEPRERIAEPMPSSSAGDSQSTNIVYRKVWGAERSAQMKPPEADEKGNQ